MTVVRITAENKIAVVRISARDRNGTQGGSTVRVSLTGFRPVTELYTTLQFMMNGGGIPLLSGQFAETNDVPFPCRVVGYTVTSDLPTNTEIAIERGTFEGYPGLAPLVGFPNIVIANVSKAGALDPSGPLLARGDIVRATIVSNSACKVMALALRVVRLSQ